MFREAGLFTFTVVIDTNRTPLDPTADTMLDKTGTGYFGIDQAKNRDLCVDLAQTIG